MELGPGNSFPTDIQARCTVGGLSQDPLTSVPQERESEAQKGKATHPIVSGTLC